MSAARTTLAAVPPLSEHELAVILRALKAYAHSPISSDECGDALGLRKRLEQ